MCFFFGGVLFAQTPVRSIFKLRISKFGVLVKQILTTRRWIVLAHRLIS